MECKAFRRGPSSRQSYSKRRTDKLRSPDAQTEQTICSFRPIYSRYFRKHPVLASSGDATFNGQVSSCQNWQEDPQKTSGLNQTDPALNDPVSALHISCIVPVYNGESFLAEALESVFAQTHPPMEIIVVDDGSTDGTRAVAASFGDRVRYEYQQNAGPASARNAGLDLARGELVAFLDADDLWHPEKLALQVARFRERPDLQIVLGHVQNFWVPELRHEEDRIGDHKLKRPLPGYVFQAMLARASVFDSVGRLDPAFRVSEDSDWFSRASACGVAMEMMPEIVVYRRFHSANISRDQGALRGGLLDVVHAALLRSRAKR